MGYGAEYKHADFASTKGLIVFTDGPEKPLRLSPSDLDLAMWNKRVGLPPAVIAHYFADSFKKIAGLDCDTAPRIIFSVREKDRTKPSMVFELWRKGAEIPDQWNNKNRGARIFRANRRLEANRVYGMWCGVTSDFNDAGGKVSLRQKGIGKKIQATLMPLFMAMSYKRFDLAASSEEAGKGAYVWPRFGAQVEALSKGSLLGLDTLPRKLQDKFNAMSYGTDISDDIKARVHDILSHADSWILARLTDIRCEIDDPAREGAKAQLSEILMRDLYVGCYFDFESPEWQKRFFSYVGADKRVDLQNRLHSFTV